MSTGAAFGNIVAASAQAAVVVTVASIALWATRVRTPGVRYAFWRVVAVLCVVLPFVQPYRPWAAAGRTSFVFDAASVAAASPTTPSFVASAVDFGAIVLVLIAIGALLRLGWLAVGVVKLRHLRARNSQSASHADEDLQKTLGTHADVRYVSRLEQPVTFGLTRPVVLLPDSLRAQSPDIRRAVVGHELIHVQRRDWAWLLVEEIALSLVWFHPAAWWLASRIQLAREEAVDELAVLLTGRRRAYVEALLAFSDCTSVVPTAAFARRRHLLHRISLVSTEDSMSSKRIVASCALMGVVLITGAWRASTAFPLHAGVAQLSQMPSGPGPLERRAHSVTPENPVPRRLHYEEMLVPDIAKSASGKIVLKITIDDSGTVAEARATQITVKSGTDFYISGDYLPAKLDTLTSMLAPDVALNARQTMTALVDSAVTSVRGWRFDPPAEAPLSFGITIRFGDASQEIFAPAPPPEQGALRVGGVIKPPVKIRDVQPVYPPGALAAGIEGVVIMEARIGTDGSVEAARVLKSVDKQIDQAAIDAVRQWKFGPTLMNGEAVPIIMTVAINFTKQ